MSTHNRVKRWKHYYLKQTPKAELFETVNSPRTKPKQRIKCLNELVRRGVQIVWT